MLQSSREDNTTPLVERAGFICLCLYLSLSYQDTQVQECGDSTEVTTLTEWAAFTFAFVFAFVFLFQNWPRRRMDHLSAYLWISAYISVWVWHCLVRTRKCDNSTCPPLMPCQYDDITKPVKNNTWLTGTDPKCSTCWSNICCIVNQVLSTLRVVICNLSRCNQIAKVSSQKGFPSLFICRFVRYTRWRWKFSFNTFLWLDPAFGWLFEMVNHENNIIPITFVLMHQKENSNLIILTID